MTVSGEFVDVLDSRSDPATWWSRTLAAEAMPGVLSPLGWSVFGASGEMSMRHGYAALGILPSDELRIPARSQDRIISVFRGRAAAQVDFFLRMGDRSVRCFTSSMSRSKCRVSSGCRANRPAC